MFKNIYKICFSPTGNTKKVLDIVSNNFNNSNVKEIDISDPNLDFNSFNFNSDDLCIFGVPSFGGIAPKIALDRINKLKGKNTFCIIVITYGNRHYDDTILQMKNNLKELGFVPAGAIASVCKHSIMTNIASNRPDDLDILELNKYSNIIKERLDNIDIEYDLDVEGDFPYKDFPGVPFKPFANDSCIKCKKCAEVCPVQAIPIDNPNKTNNNICITCMRCVSVCPVNARSLGEENLNKMISKFGALCEGRKDNKLF